MWWDLSEAKSVKYLLPTYIQKKVSLVCMLNPLPEAVVEKLRFNKLIIQIKL